jgi:NAD(P)-dependent dehydrogenase (short-subunit alcohol dehydrogenase family)
MSGKPTAIITGAAGGIGEGLVEGFLRRLFTLLTCHKGRPDLAPQSHSRVAGLPLLGIRNSQAYLNWRKRATFRSDGRGLESVIPA